MSILASPIFHDETAAREYLEAQRWPNGPVCPHCGSTEGLHRLAGKSHRPGLFQCNECRGHFSVTVGTVFERSHIPLHKWLAAAHLMSASKKGISAHQIHRLLKITYKSAWFMCHRLREAMRDPNPPPMGGEGEIVQADETYFGTKDAFRGKSWEEKKGHSKKMSVVSLVSGGKARTFHVASATRETVQGIMSAHASFKSELHTDERYLYRNIGVHFAAHETVNHSRGEYVRGHVHINKVENYFSVFKKGMSGVYQHCSEKHLQRYLSEFDFRYNHRSGLGFTDWERTAIALRGIAGKRLTYRRTNSGRSADHRPA